MQILEFPESDIGKRKAYKFRMADGRNGEHISGMVRFWVYHITADDGITVDMNGREIDPSKINRIAAGEMRCGLPGMRFEITLEDCVPLRGDNELGIVLQTKAKRQEVPYMEELDIVVES